MFAFTNRYEIKYLVEATRKAELRETIGGFFSTDPNGDSQGTYVNYSIYFDSPNYRFYGEKREGDLVRIKPRIRLYRSAPSAPPSAVFLELKARYDRIVEKRRVPIDLDLARRLLSRGPLFLSDRELENSVLAEFKYLHDRFALSPVTTVVYYRTALNGQFQDNVRLTLDEELHCSLSTTLNVPPGDLIAVVPPTHFIVELKFNDRISETLLQKLRYLGMEQQTLSKYAMAMETSHDYMREKFLLAGWVSDRARDDIALEHRERGGDRPIF
ncbi:MAG: polyphosphate polymerase domain-containing protein [Alphaproteobacteria bacterium]|nr:polyphosphate polymerase domain-containing protein [Alphaproteobacteria bacterium]